MAELPDLTVFADILSRKFTGQTVEEITITEARKLNVSADKLKTTLEGKKLEMVTREGKTLQFHFAGGEALGLHLMLRGELVDLEADETPRFQVMAMRFDNGKGFAVVDLQKQATLTLQPPPLNVPDALAMDGEYFADLLSKKRTLIKTLLMDQKLVRGIGNSYADEILYHAGISPFSVAKSIPANRVSKLYKSIADVLNKAVKQIAEANDDELRGELKDFMTVHSPKLKTTAKGEAIKTEKIGGRTTYYTDAQELYM
ncbi:formamidopyrimidine-DNA glycosylase [Mucilaginibacter pallidiroseus]|uniref:Formamidopyrimidine-DNA glycosylase n=1 Tax=Mucilaginibacter pallidiroseus TaxID=2599295 RepID=A0A563TZB7_9SPHI|nr:DNA-formamidopyrimidine glycosylase family protein [Mucilaginibacter pallidiroseus]TWR24714.1 formamidopyrimidine-DNA glycosylase [Mucilaginibacter pallidiroseus]